MVHPEADPSRFGFPLTLRPHVNRRDFIRWLEEVKMETRLAFAGNILKRPGLLNIPERDAYVATVLCLALCAFLTLRSVVFHAADA